MEAEAGAEVGVTEWEGAEVEGAKEAEEAEAEVVVGLMDMGAAAGMAAGVEGGAVAAAAAVKSEERSCEGPARPYVVKEQETAKSRRR